MRLLVVTHNYPRFPGDPAGSYVRRLAEAARDVGHEVLVLAPHVAGTAETDKADASHDASPHRPASDSYCRLRAGSRDGKVHQWQVRAVTRRRLLSSRNA